MDKKQIDQYPAVIQPHLRTISNTREELIALIKSPVKKHGCIGTFYRNLGEHHSKDQTEEEFGNSPIVVIRNETYNSYGGFEGNTVYDLFIDPEDSKLLVTLNGEAGEDFDEPIEHVQVEGLLCIVSWLAENGFIEAEDETPWRCEECGSTNVHLKAWVDPNNANIFISDCEDFEHSYCNSCEQDVKIITHDALMVEINEWWDMRDFVQMAKVTGLVQSNYDPADGYQALVDACDTFWNSLSDSQKIEIWK